MEWVETETLDSKLIESNNIDTCQLFACKFHEISFSINENGQVLSLNHENAAESEFPNRIAQAVVSCQEDTETCHFYFRSVTNQVYEWNVNISQQHLRKRAKLEGSSDSTMLERYHMIASNIRHIMPFKNTGVLLFSNQKLKHYNSKTKSLTKISDFSLNDINITSHQYFEKLDSSFKDFFSLGALKNGLVFITKDGSVYWRNLDKDPVEDTKILVFEGSEKVKLVDLLCAPTLSKDLNTLIAIGDRGTIMIYSKHPKEAGLSFKQFNIQSPIHSIDKAHKDLVYLVSSGIGRVSLLNFKFTADDVDLKSTHLQNISHVKHLKMRDSSNYLFDVLCNEDQTVKMMNIKFNPTPVSIANNPEAISLLIKDTLAELEFSEVATKSLDIQEQELNQRLSSTNRTLYALRNINSKRKLGVCNSLESTGFEFSMRPIIKTESIANSSLHSTAYLRICIKTSRFLELENWDLLLDLLPHTNSASKCLLGETKTVPVMGFESHYENGIERYSIWERDIEMDLEKLRLPLLVSATLVMSIDEQDNLPLRFPVSKTLVDDLHYAIPCNPDFIISIERRGLAEISSRLMDSCNRQKQFDKSGRYPFARLIRSKSSYTKTLPKYLFNYRNVHIKCLVDPNMTDKNYRSILSSILNEGRTMEDMKSILQSAEQALFTLAAYPGCPIILKLSRVSSTVIDLSVQCVHPPALFKTQAALLARLYDNFVNIPNDKIKANDDGDGQQRRTFLKKLKSLEESILELQEKYQKSGNKMDIDNEQDDLIGDQLKKSVDLLFDIYNEEPIGYFTI